MTVILSYYPAMASFWFVFPGNGEGCMDYNVNSAINDNYSKGNKTTMLMMTSTVITKFTPMTTIIVTRYYSNEGNDNDINYQSERLFHFAPASDFYFSYCISVSKFDLWVNNLILKHFKPWAIF